MAAVTPKRSSSGRTARVTVARANTTFRSESSLASSTSVLPRCGLEAATYREITAALTRIARALDPSAVERLRSYVTGLAQTPPRTCQADNANDGGSFALADSPRPTSQSLICELGQQLLPCPALPLRANQRSECLDLAR